MPDPAGGMFGIAWKIAKDAVPDPHDTKDPQHSKDLKAQAAANMETINNFEKRRSA